MDRSTLKILNKDFKFLGDIEDYISFYFIRSFFQAKEFKLVAPIKYSYLLTEGNYIYLSKYKSMIIEEIEIDEEKCQIIIKGRDIKSILERRVTIPPIGVAYDEFKGTAEDTIKHYIQVNCINPVDKSRKISNLSLAPNKRRGKDIKWQSRYKNLMSEVEGISRNAGLGWFIYLDYKEKKFIFDVEVGINRTESQDVNSRVIFSSNFDNISKAIHKSSSLPYKNIGYVGGRGEGAEREIVEVRKKNSTELDRREIFIDARDIAENDKLEDRGLTKLSELDYVFNSESTVLNNNLLYEKDWNLGDLVTIKNNFGINNLRVVEVREIYEGKLNIEVVVGSIEGTILEQINSDVSELSNEIATVQKIWRPNIDVDGELSWEINSSLENPSVQNIKGPKGDRGESGQQGIQGQRGETGSQGIQGVAGPKGDIGLKGDKGETGIQGQKGDIGLTGSQGPKGDTGLKGSIGEKGAQGIQGIKGDKGEQGIQGPIGSTQSYIVFHQHFIATNGQTLFEWNDGYTYPLNVNAIAVYLNGVRLSNRIINQLRNNAIQFKAALSEGDKVFIEAYQMVVDLQGPKGEQGIQGIKGDTGAVGPVGAKGATGAQGIQGVAGPKGDIGLRGESGERGIQGIQGITGAKGDKGDIGVKGDVGIIGPIGPVGANGITWRPNVDSTGNLTWSNNGSSTIPTNINIKGPKGDVGAKGNIGDIGATGATGSQGIQGIPGAKGETGAKGNTGDKGATGATGAAGKDGTQIITSSSKPSGQISGRVWVQLI